jgi:flavin-binding protein dodecin
MLMWRPGLRAGRSGTRVRGILAGGAMYFAARGATAHRPRENDMPGHIYKSLELTGSSAVSIDDAVQTAIGKAAKTIRKLRWFEVQQIRGHIEDDKVAHWQVSMKVGFALDD